MHVPSIVQSLAGLKAKGVDTVAVTAVNDVFVMDAWAKASGPGAAKLEFIADGNGDFAKALGLESDASKYGMGIRSKRFALYADDGVVKVLHVEAPGEFRVSSAEAMLAVL
jgi:peroxiredoxin